MPDVSEEEKQGLEGIAKIQGFENKEELFRLIARVDLMAPGNLDAFLKWNSTDGSKAGLMKLAMIPEKPKEEEPKS